MSRLPSLVLAAFTLAAIAVPAAAGAAYAPKLTVTVDPATPNAPTALTSTIVQAGGETASKRVRLVLPQKFGPSPGTTLKPCDDAQKAARACPPESKMGDALAQTPVGTFTGTVNYGPLGPRGPRIFVFLSNGFSLLDQTIEGTIVITPAGFETVFEGLPDVQTSSFQLKLDGAPRTLLNTPRDCGDYPFKAEFESQEGEKATGESVVTIAGCPNRAPRIGEVTASSRRVVAFSLNEAAQVSVQVKRGKTVVFSKAFAGKVGRNTLKVRKLKAGRYRVVVRATDAEGGRRVGSGVLVVRRR